MPTPSEEYLESSKLPYRPSVSYVSTDALPSIGVYAHKSKIPEGESDAEIGALTIDLSADKKKSLVVIGDYNNKTNVFTAQEIKFPDGKIQKLEEQMSVNLGANYEYEAIDKIANFATEQADLHLKNEAALALAVKQKKSEPTPENHHDEKGILASLIQHWQDFKLVDIVPSFDASAATTSMPLNLPANAKSVATVGK